MANTDINTDDHFRLFMVPGMTQCAVSPCPDTLIERCLLTSESSQYGPSAWAFGANEHRFRAPHLQEGPRYDGESDMAGLSGSD